MAEVDALAQPTGPDSVRVYWSETTPGSVYYVYKDAVLLGSTTQTWFLVTLAAGECAHISVFDDSADVPDAGFPGYFRFEWDASTGATSYRIEEYIDTTWTTISTIPSTADTHYSYNTPYLADGTEHQFRMVAANANDSAARLITVLMVRRPDPPDVTYTYDSDTGDLTVDE